MKTYSAITPTARSHRSWLAAYRMFLTNPQERLSIKVLPLIAIGVVPASMASDVLLPFIGMLDNIPTALFVMFAAFKTWQRVRLYR